MFTRVENFLKIEKNARLFEKRLCNVPIWIYIRLEVYRIIEAQKLNIDFVPVCRRSKLNVSVRCGVQEKELYFEKIVEKYSSSRVLIINDKHRYVSQPDGIAYTCPITGWVSEIVDVPVGICSQVYRDNLNIPSDNDIQYDYAFCQKNDKISEQAIDIYVLDIKKTFTKGLSVVLNEQFQKILKEQIKYVLECMEYSVFYSRLFDRLNIQMLVLSSYYSIMQMIVCKQARKHNIPVVEIQHGTTGFEHIAYNSLVCDGLPALYDYAVPDYFLCYGQFEVENTRPFCEKNKIIPIGNPFLQKFSSQTQFSLEGYHQEAKQKQHTILFIAFNTDNDRLEKMAYDWKLLNPEDMVIYRFHPEEKINPATVAKLKNANIVCSEDFQISIYELNRKADYVIGTSSTALYESLAFGKKVAVLEGGKMQAERRESEKYLCHIASIEDVRKFIYTQSTQAKQNQTVQYFYQMTDKSELRRCLHRIMS